MSLKLGLQAVEEQQYTRAVDLLEYFCQNCYDYKSQEYIQAKIGLARAYYGLGQREQVVYICQELINSDRLSVRQWAQQWLNSIQAVPKYTPEELKTIFNQGRKALKQKNYPAAIKFLEEYCQHNHQPELPENQQAKMGLIQAYTGTKDFKAAVTLCEELNFSHDTMIQDWAKEKLPALKSAQQKQKQSKYDSDATYIERPNIEQQEATENPKIDIYAQATIKANYLNKRATQVDVKLKMPKIGSNLSLAIIVTVTSIIFLTFVPIFAIIWLFWSNLILVALGAIILSLIINFILLGLSTKLIDNILTKVYSPRWVDLTEIRYYSPEAAEVIERICTQYKLKTPRLGIIKNTNPTAFSYGGLRRESRIVVTQGLFSYLNEDESATVYAHELAQIINWDCSIITLGYSFLASLILLGVTIKKSPVIFPDFIYTVTTYGLFYLSRVREYYADHFAAEVTGNPNALIRALRKIAYGIVEENERSQQRTNLLTETRLFAIFDSNQAIPTGITTDTDNIGKIITWDMVNPWGNWVELNTTHPLTGKRIEVLADYAEQLDLEIEYNLSNAISEAKKLEQSKLKQNFWLDWLIFYLPIMGIIGGLSIALLLYLIGKPVTMLLTLPLLSFGVGKIIKNLVMYPYKQTITNTNNIISLFSSPYTSAMRSNKVKLSGELLSNQESYFALQDQTALIKTRYFRVKNNPSLGSQVKAIGWFRRGVTPYLDLIELKIEDKLYKSTYYLGNLSLGLGALILAILTLWL
ncbi:MAG: hypothetical protein EA365_00305 [Gloeocapsa sp. DLM2.Bin57]|nr:MAG: hypothetical protein EA365_00305 [Gloeocapsa sp. DLM2.Bin57]